MSEVLAYDALPVIQALVKPVLHEGKGNQREQDFLAGIIRIMASGRCTHLSATQAGMLASLYAKVILIPQVPADHQRRRTPSGSVLAVPAEPTPADQREVCQKCHDSHQVWSLEHERFVMCTSCPTPCEKCRSRPIGGGPGGAYCAETPCSCDCHTNTR
jgi:hypothetical protein